MNAVRATMGTWGLACLMFVSVAPKSLGITIHVPADQPTIQLGIDASSDGDTVLVAPGTYVENIQVNQDIVVRGSEGPAVTVIDGGSPANPDSASVVWMSAGIVEGFDIRNGTGTVHWGGSREGGGVYVYAADYPPGPTVQANWIHHNVLDLAGVSDATRGGGVFVRTSSDGCATIIESNRIYNNETRHPLRGGEAAGIHAHSYNPAHTLIHGNEVYDNHAWRPEPGGEGHSFSFNVGGIYATSSTVTGNIIVCNVAWGASGLKGTGGVFENNTIVANLSDSLRAAMYVWRPFQSLTIYGNNITHNLGPGLDCNFWGGPFPLEIECNNFFLNGPGGNVTGECSGVIGQDGNISVDPLYGQSGWPCDPGYWCLSHDSPLLINLPPTCFQIGATGLCPPIGITDTESVAPRQLQVSAPRPNPFTSRTTIPFYLATDSEVEVQIYNVLGRRIRTLHTDWLFTGDHVLEWDGRIESGDRAASGAYVARIRAGGEELTRTLLLVR